MLKKSINLRGHATSISVEDPFWVGLVSIAQELNMPINALVAHVDDARLGHHDAWHRLWCDVTDSPPSLSVLRAHNLSSSLRIFVYSRALFKV